MLSRDRPHTDSKLGHTPLADNLEPTRPGCNELIGESRLASRYLGLKRSSPGLNLLIIFLVAQILVGRTELDAQTSKRDLDRKQISPFDVSHLIADLPKVTIHRKSDQQFKLKLSPTKIKFLCCREKLSGESLRSSAAGSSLRLPQESTVNFTYLKSVNPRRFEPAYEIWFSGASSASINQSPVSDHMGVLQSNKVKPVSERLKTTRVVNHRLDLNSVRNLLPKPVNLVTSQSRLSGVRTRSVQQDQNEPEYDGATSESDESEYTEQNDPSQPTSNTESMGDASKLTSVGDVVEYRNDSSSPQKESENDTSDQDQINFDVLEDGQVRAESKSWPESPVYPPGDLDRLYSDALLVYVKDFNQYITR